MQATMARNSDIGSQEEIIIAAASEEEFSLDIHLRDEEKLRRSERLQERAIQLERGAFGDIRNLSWNRVCDLQQPRAIPVTGQVTEPAVEVIQPEQTTGLTSIGNAVHNANSPAPQVDNSISAAPEVTNFASPVQAEVDTVLNDSAALESEVPLNPTGLVASRKKKKFEDKPSWSQVLKMPPDQQNEWVDAMEKEFNDLIRRGQIREVDLMLEEMPQEELYRTADPLHDKERSFRGVPLP